MAQNVLKFNEIHVGRMILDQTLERTPYMQSSNSCIRHFISLGALLPLKSSYNSTTCFSCCVIQSWCSCSSLSLLDYSCCSFSTCRNAFAFASRMFASLSVFHSSFMLYEHDTVISSFSQIFGIYLGHVGPL